MTKSEIELSILIPVYNEEKNIFPLYSELKEIKEIINEQYEIIFVDDGSTDKTYSLLKKLKEENKIWKIYQKMKIIQLKRNFGKSVALSVGFKNCKGKYIITIDGDLQHDINDIPKFIDKISEGYDVVVGWRFHRKDILSKRFFSKIFNKSISMLTGVKIHDSNCGFKIFKKEIISNLNIYGENYRYLPSLIHMNGGRVGEIKVKHRPRKYGKSKYNYTRLLKGFLDLITVTSLSFRNRPLHLFGSIGLCFILIGIALKTTPIIIIGVQFFSTGLLGEFITSIKKENKDIYTKEVIK